MVVHEPGDWLVESLKGLADQDYGSVQVLVLVSGTSENPGARIVLDSIESILPQAVLRFLGGNPGFAGACNTALDLVKGDSGFFCFMHDDVVLAPSAISSLVEELYRSNAGVVGPKLVHWDNPRMIQSVGSAVDRFGVELPYADDSELDQEQHDSVQDVFVLSSSCLMVRADLFKLLNGFNSSLHSSGVDLDFCWRVHSTGARVVIVPSAVARHREAMADRLTDEQQELVDVDSEFERVRTIVSLSSRGQLLFLFVQLLLFTAARCVLLTVTGRARRAFVEARAVLSLPFSLGDIRERRDAMSAIRTVDGDEIRALQILGSSHTTAYFRRRARRAGLAQAQSSTETREPTPRGAYIMWSVLLLLLVIGSRSLLLNGSVSVGQMVPFASSACDAWSSYASGWWSAGFGQISAAPTGVALTAVGTVIAFGQSGLAHTLSIVLLPLVGWLGVWRFASVMGTRGGRISAVVAYAAVPLPYAAIASGQWGALLLYALMPWMVHLLRMAVGHADITSTMSKEVMVFMSPAMWRQWFAGLSLVTAIALAFEPATLLLVPFVGVVVALVSFTQGVSWRWAIRWIGISLAAVLVAIALNLPWSGSYIRSGWWEALTGAPIDGGRDIGLWGLATFDIGGFFGSSLSVALYAAVAGALLLVRGARTAWALRGAALVVGGLLVAILDDASLLPAHAPDSALLLVPVAFGIAMCAGAMGASLAIDLGRGKFSWRQPLGALVGVAFAVGLVPSSLNAIDGSWNQPELALPQLLVQLPEGDVSGNYRTMFIGDARVLPGAPLNFGWGISYSVVNGRGPSVTELWETPPTRARDNAVAAMYGIVRGQTARAGRLLAPLSVRFIVVPIIDGAQSTRDRPLDVPRGLVEALSRQLDLRRRFTSPDLIVFENTSWVPTRSTLTAAGATSSSSAGATSMITSDISGATALPYVQFPHQASEFDAQPGTLHLSVPYTSRWTATLNGQDIPVRPAFGLTNAYDIQSAGRVRLSFETSRVHTVLVFLQVLAWIVVLVLASSRRRFLKKKTTPAQVAPVQEPVLTFAVGEKS